MSYLHWRKFDILWKKDNSLWIVPNRFRMVVDFAIHIVLIIAMSVILIEYVELHKIKTIEYGYFFVIVGLFFSMVKDAIKYLNSDTYLFDKENDQIKHNGIYLGKISNIYAIDVNEHVSSRGKTKYVLKVLVDLTGDIVFEPESNKKHLIDIGQNISKLTNFNIEKYNYQKRLKEEKAQEDALEISEIQTYQQQVLRYEERYQVLTEAELRQIVANAEMCEDCAVEAARNLLERKRI